MAVTLLDPITALIVIDLQRATVAMPTAHPTADVVRQSVALIEAFHRHGLPVVLVNANAVAPGRTEQSRSMRDMPAGWSDLLPDLGQQPSDHIVTKRTWGAFMYTDLDAWLKSRGVTQVVIVGIATSAGVESTARQAHEHGYNVTLAIDAMTDMNADAHENSVARIFPKLGETGTARAIIDLLDRNRA